jgi:hypothetical protein
MFTITFALAALATVGMQQTVFACKMNALSPSEREELPKLLHHLAELKPEVLNLKEGYEIRFGGKTDAFPTAAKWLAMEQRCCPFFELSLAVTSNDGPVVVKISGPTGTKAFIDDDLPLIHRLASARSEK